MTIMVDSAAWASKFRFVSHHLVPALNELDPIFKATKQIHVKVLNQRVEQEAPTYQRPQLNQENARGLETLADSVNDDDLKAALTRLAQKAKPES